MAAGEPLAALAANEIIHRQTLLAISAALVAAAVLVLAVLRSLKGWVLSLAPAAAFVTLTASLVVLLNPGARFRHAGRHQRRRSLADRVIDEPGPVALANRFRAAASRRCIRAALLPPVVLAGRGGAAGPVVAARRR